MKLRLKHQHEGVWFSDNGHRAYLRGERPACLLEPGGERAWQPTLPHHIQRLRRTVRKDNYSWELVLFYAQ